VTAATYQEHVPASVPRAPFIGPDGTYTRSGQALAYILGFISLAFIPATVAAAVLYTVGEARFRTDPESARQLMNWSWIALLIVPVLTACAVPVSLVVTALL
jgi:hypothetical protein